MIGLLSLAAYALRAVQHEENSLVVLALTGLIELLIEWGIVYTTLKIFWY